jgi:periplasmic protein TonB
MFEDSIFESTGSIHTRSRSWMFATLTFNGSILLALVLIPLIHPEALPRQALAFFLETPPPLEQPAQPKEAPRQFHGTPEVQGRFIFVPSIIPKLIGTFHDTGQPPTSDVPGLEQSSALPEDANVFSSRRTSPVVRSGNHGPLRISSMVVEGLLIRKNLPVYPPIAKAAGVQGTVVLQATISKAGTIENLRVMSGHPMLQQAALDAVQHWRYRPYLLDGQPVEVETTVNVVFTLGR